MIPAKQQPEHNDGLFAHGLWMFASAIAGSIFVAGGFFNKFPDSANLPMIVGLIGFFGTMAFFVGLAFMHGDSAARWCFGVVVAVAVLTLTVLTMSGVITRAGSPHAVGFVSDSTVQIESAAGLLLKGQNPYSADFIDTPSVWRFDPHRIGQGDSSRFHFVYAPLSAIAAIPVILLADLFSIPPDGRWLSVLALVIIWLVFMKRETTVEGRMRMTLLTIGNPLLYLCAVTGFYDLIIAAALIMSALFGQKGRWMVSAFFLALAVGFKQTSWLFAVVWLAWAWPTMQATNRQARFRGIMMLLGLTVVIFTPFILWDPAAFFTDVILYMSLAQSTSVSTAGPALGPYLSMMTKNFPGLSELVEIVFVMIGLIIALLMVRRNRTASWWLIGGAVATLALFMSHQFFYYNYAVGLVTMLVAAYAFQKKSPQDE